MRSIEARRPIGEETHTHSAGQGFLSLRGEGRQGGVSFVSRATPQLPLGMQPRNVKKRQSRNFGLLLKTLHGGSGGGKGIECVESRLQKGILKHEHHKAMEGEDKE